MPTCKFRIIPERHLQTHGWRRQPRLLENPVKGEAHFRVCTGTLERLMDERSARRPEWKPRRKQKKRRPRQFVKSNDSAGTNQLRQEAQDSKGSVENHQNETRNEGVEGFAARN